jgi:hypothetical protein
MDRHLRHLRHRTEIPGLSNLSKRGQLVGTGPLVPPFQTDSTASPYSTEIRLDRYDYRSLTLHWHALRVAPACGPVGLRSALLSGARVTHSAGESRRSLPFTSASGLWKYRGPPLATPSKGRGVFNA